MSEVIGTLFFHTKTFKVSFESADVLKEHPFMILVIKSHRSKGSALTTIINITFIFILGIFTGNGNRKCKMSIKNQEMSILIIPDMFPNLTHRR